MGACCSHPNKIERKMEEQEVETQEGDFGARVRVKGSCNSLSMFTKQGKKGINQDALAIWEDFNGERDMIFCGVFDGHGPLGHRVSRRVRDILPSKLSSELKSNARNEDLVNREHSIGGSDDSDDNEDKPHISSWESSFIKAFKVMDEDLKHDSTINTYTSGTTAVSMLKKGKHLMMANLGDSRAILCTTNDKNQHVAVQLTVDLKPNNPGEAERIKSCSGRVFSLEEEKDVYRMWMPNQDSPGLAMSRAFGDFCLKDYGLISIPEVYYRKLSTKDECIVLATDGVWDVLSNNEVVRIVTSTKKRSEAARILVKHAVRAWRTRYPTSKVDDCAVICFFLNPQSLFRDSFKDVDEENTNDQHYPCSSKTLDRAESHLDVESPKDEDSVTWHALEGVTRVNSVVNIPRFANGDSWQRSIGINEGES